MVLCLVILTDIKVRRAGLLVSVELYIDMHGAYLLWQRVCPSSQPVLCLND